MSFLSPAFLFALAALGVPVWLHLARRRKIVPIPFSSLRYLKQASARVRRQARLEDLGLLILRLLVIAALVLALARPVINERRSLLGLEWPRAAVVVVDATAGMGARVGDGTRLDEAKRLAEAWIRQLSVRDKVALWVLTDRVEKPVPVPVAGRDEVLVALSALQPSEGSASLAPVFAAAREWAREETRGMQEVVVFTDNAPAAWDWPAQTFFKASWPKNGPRLLVVQTDNEKPGNLCLREVTVQGSQARAGRTVEGSARIENHSGAAATDLLEVKVGGQSVLRKSVDLPPEGSADVPFSFAVPAENGTVLAGEASLTGDTLTADDRWVFALPAQRTVPVAVVENVSGTVGRVRPSFFLGRALAAGGAAAVETLESTAWNNHSLAKTQAVFATGGALAAEADWRKAVEFVKSGGTLVLFANNSPEKPPPEWPVGVGQEMSLPPGRVATKLLTPEHPLFRGLWSPASPFPPLPQGTALRCAPAAGGRVLATLAGELPLVVESVLGNGRLVWLNTSADRAWGDLPLSPAFVPLMHQLARLRDLSTRAPTQRWVGEAWPTVEGASWPRADDASASSRATKSGLFPAVASDGQPVWQCAVNVRRDESELRPASEDAIAALLPGKLVTGSAGLQQWQMDAQRQVPLWPWFLALAGFFFLTESWLAHRAALRRGGGPVGPVPGLPATGAARPPKTREGSLAV